MVEPVDGSPKNNALAIKSALEYLHGEALMAGLCFVAHLVGAASAAVELDRRHSDEAETNPGFKENGAGGGSTPNDLEPFTDNST